MYVTISTSRCGCVPKPRLPWTRSSFMTRSTPNCVFFGLRYSANEKWKRDLSQLPLVHSAFFSFALLPNICGGGSETYSWASGMCSDVSTIRTRDGERPGFWIR
eukprot:scaffold15188_cov65-Phaeocystis_antarctica.AAC.2